MEDGFDRYFRNPYYKLISGFWKERVLPCSNVPMRLVFFIDVYVMLKFLYFTELKLPWGIFWRKKHGDDPVTSYPLNFIGEESKILTIQDIRFLFSLKHNKGFLGFFLFRKLQSVVLHDIIYCLQVFAVLWFIGQKFTYYKILSSEQKQREDYQESISLKVVHWQ